MSEIKQTYQQLEQELEVWRNGPSCWSCGDSGDVHQLDGEWLGKCNCLAAQLIDVTAERDKMKDENDRLKHDLGAIDKALRGKVNDPDPLPPILPGAFSVETTYGLVAGILRERDQLKAESKGHLATACMYNDMYSRASSERNTLRVNLADLRSKMELMAENSDDVDVVSICRETLSSLKKTGD
jgi:hypothetical protein